MREHESAVKRQRRVKTLLKHFAGKAARGLEGKWKEGDALDPGLEAALARELPEGTVQVYKVVLVHPTKYFAFG